MQAVGKRVPWSLIGLGCSVISQSNDHYLTICDSEGIQSARLIEAAAFHKIIAFKPFVKTKSPDVCVCVCVRVCVCGGGGGMFTSNS